MKEYLSNIDPVDYDQIIYAQLVMGWMIGQLSLDGDILFMANPERYAPVPIEEPVIKPERHPLQGEFLLPRPIKLKGLKVK